MHVLGFTDKIPEYFRAVDLLVTKAGPGTLAEANAAQLPVVVYDFVPGQERGNVDFVRHNGLGLIALQGASTVVSAVRSLISNPESLDDDSPEPRDRRAPPQLSPNRRADRLDHRNRQDPRSGRFLGTSSASGGSGLASP